MTEDQKDEIRDVVRALLVEEILPQLARKLLNGRLAVETASHRPRDTMAIIGEAAAAAGARAGAQFAVDSRRAECVETRQFSPDEIAVPLGREAVADEPATSGRSYLVGEGKPDFFPFSREAAPPRSPKSFPDDPHHAE